MSRRPWVQVLFDLLGCLQLQDSKTSAEGGGWGVAKNSVRDQEACMDAYVSCIQVTVSN